MITEWHEADRQGFSDERLFTQTETIVLRWWVLRKMPLLDQGYIRGEYLHRISPRFAAWNERYVRGVSRRSQLILDLEMTESSKIALPTQTPASLHQRNCWKMLHCWKSSLHRTFYLSAIKILYLEHLENVLIRKAKESNRKTNKHLFVFVYLNVF